MRQSQQLYPTWYSQPAYTPLWEMPLVPTLKTIRMGIASTARIEVARFSYVLDCDLLKRAFTFRTLQARYAKVHQAVAFRFRPTTILSLRRIRRSFQAPPLPWSILWRQTGIHLAKEHARKHSANRKARPQVRRHLEKRDYIRQGLVWLGPDEKHNAICSRLCREEEFEAARQAGMGADESVPIHRILERERDLRSAYHQERLRALGGSRYVSQFLPDGWETVYDTPADS